MDGEALRVFLRSFHERYPGITAASMASLTDESGQSSYCVLAQEALAGTVAPRVLDLGCGDGVLLAQVAKMSPAAQLTGIDLVPAEIALAKARLSHAVLVCGDITQPLPFPDSAFDVVTAHLVMMLLGPIETTIAQVARVLRPGGSFTFCIDDFAEDGAAFTHLVNVAIAAAGNEPRNPAPRAAADRRVYEPNALESLLSDHGLAMCAQWRVLFRGTVDSRTAWEIVRGTYSVGAIDAGRLDRAERAVKAEVEKIGNPIVTFPLKYISAKRVR